VSRVLGCVALLDLSDSSSEITPAKATRGWWFRVTAATSRAPRAATREAVGGGELAGGESAPLADEVTKTSNSGCSELGFASAGVGVEFLSTGNFS
jgi:hypothetical protein